MLDWLRHSKRKVRVGKNRLLQKMVYYKKNISKWNNVNISKICIGWFYNILYSNNTSKVVDDLFKYFILYFCSLSKLSS